MSGKDKKKRKRPGRGRQAPERSRSAAPASGSSADGRAWWRVLVEVAAVIAVPSALLYVLGMLAFWLRIANEYDRVNIGTTWYAASLVPRSTAAASGVEAIVRGFVGGSLLNFAVLFVVYVVLYARAKKEGREHPVHNYPAPPSSRSSSMKAAGRTTRTGSSTGGSLRCRSPLTITSAFEESARATR